MRSLTSTWGNWKAQPESREIFLVGLPSWGTQNIQVCHSHVRDQMDIHSLISEYWFFVSFWWKSKLWYCMQYCFSMMCLFLLKRSVTSLIEVNIVLNLKTWNIAGFLICLDGLALILIDSAHNSKIFHHIFCKWYNHVWADEWLQQQHWLRGTKRSYNFIPSPRNKLRRKFHTAIRLICPVFGCKLGVHQLFFHLWFVFKSLFTGYFNTAQWMARCVALLRKRGTQLCRLGSQSYSVVRENNGSCIKWS